MSKDNSLTPWYILEHGGNPAMAELILEDVKAIKTIREARRYIDSHATDKKAMLHLWTTWTGSKDRLECTSLRQLAGALRDAVPEVQCLVVIAWCTVVDLSMYGRKDGEYPRKALCAQAYQILCDKQNEVARLREAEAIKALQGSIR